jgi:hypothetical protein
MEKIYPNIFTKVEGQHRKNTVHGGALEWQR